MTVDEIQSTKDTLAAVKSQERDAVAELEGARMKARKILDPAENRLKDLRSRRTELEHELATAEVTEQ